MKTVYICGHCGSAYVVRDAWVHVNDEDDVQTFDDTYCRHCETTDPAVMEILVAEDFDIYSDVVNLDDYT